MLHPNALSLASLEGPDFFCEKYLHLISKFRHSSPIWCSGDSSCLTPRTFVAQTFEAGRLTSRFLMSKTFNAKTFDFGDI